MYDAVFHPDTYKKGQEVWLSMRCFEFQMTFIVCFPALIPMFLATVLSFVTFIYDVLPEKRNHKFPKDLMHKMCTMWSHSLLYLIVFCFQQDKRFKQLMIDTAFDGIQREFKVTLDRKSE